MRKSIRAVVHESAKELHKAGAINDLTMREFDALVLPSIKEYSAPQIRRIRLKARAS